MTLLKAYLMNKRDPFTLAKVFLEEHNTIKKGMQRVLVERMGDLGGDYFFNQSIWYEAEIEEIDIELEEWAEKREKRKVHHNTINAAVRKLNVKKDRYREQLDLLEEHYSTIMGHSRRDMSPKIKRELLTEGKELLEKDIAALKITLNADTKSISGLEADLEEIKRNQDNLIKDYMDNPEVSDKAKKDFQNIQDATTKRMQQARKEQNTKHINDNKDINWKIFELEQKVLSTTSKIEEIVTGKTADVRFKEKFKIKAPPQKVKRFYDAAFDLVGFTFDQLISTLHDMRPKNWKFIADIGKGRNWWDVLEMDWAQLTSLRDPHVQSPHLQSKYPKRVPKHDIRKYKNPFRNIPSHWPLKTYARNIQGKLHKYDSKTGKMSPVNEEQITEEYKESDSTINHRRIAKDNKLKTWIYKLEQPRAGKGGSGGKIKNVTLVGDYEYQPRESGRHKWHKLIGGELKFTKGSEIETLFKNDNIKTSDFLRQVLELNPQLKTIPEVLIGDPEPQKTTSAVDRVPYSEEEIAEAEEIDRKKGSKKADWMRRMNETAGGKIPGKTKTFTPKSWKEWEEWKEDFEYVVNEQNSDIGSSLESFFRDLPPDVLNMFDEKSTPTASSDYGLARVKADGGLAKETKRHNSLRELGEIFQLALDDAELTDDQKIDVRTILAAIRKHLSKHGQIPKDLDPKPEETDRTLNLLFEFHDEANMLLETDDEDEFKEAPKEELEELIEEVKSILTHLDKENPDENDYIQILIRYYAIMRLIDELKPKLPRSAIMAKQKMKDYLEGLRVMFKDKFGKVANKELKRLQQLAVKQASKEKRELTIPPKKDEKPKGGRKLSKWEISKLNKEEWEMYIEMAQNLLEYEVKLPDKAIERLDKPLSPKDEPSFGQRKEGEGFIVTAGKRQKPKKGETMTVTIKNRYRKPDGSIDSDAIKKIVSIIYPKVKLKMDAEEQRGAGFRSTLTQQRIDQTRRRIVNDTARNPNNVNINQYPHLFDRRVDIVGGVSYAEEEKRTGEYDPRTKTTRLSAEERGIDINQGEFVDAAADKLRQVIEQDDDNEFDNIDEKDAVEAYEQGLIDAAQEMAGYENVQIEELGHEDAEETKERKEGLKEMGDISPQMREALWDAKEGERQKEYIDEMVSGGSSKREAQDAWRTDPNRPKSFADQLQQEKKQRAEVKDKAAEAKRAKERRTKEFGTKESRAKEKKPTIPPREFRPRPSSIDEDETAELDWPSLQEEEE